MICSEDAYSTLAAPVCNTYTELKEHVRGLLNTTRVPYVQNFVIETYTCDFLTKRKSPVAIVCKTRMKNGWVPMFGNLFQLMLAKNIENAIIVTLYETKTIIKLRKRWEPLGIQIIESRDLAATLYKLGQ